MPEQEQMKKIHGGHRASCTRMVREVCALFTSTDQNGA